MADKTANEEIHDATLRRQVYLEKYTQGAQKAVNALLDGSEEDLRSVLERRLSRLITSDGLAAAGGNVERAIQALALQVAQTRGEAIDSSFSDLTDQLGTLGPNEAQYMDRSFRQYAPVHLDTVLPATQQLASIILSEPMQGKLLSEWADSLKAADVDRIMSTVRSGMALGQTTDQIVRGVLGTDIMNGADGVTEVTRRNAAAITQTAIATTANEARAAYSEANSDIVGAEVWVATLDGDTCEECAALDGQQFAVGEGDQPPAHYNCRCVRVPTLDGTLIGDRPFTSATEDELAGLSEDERAQRVQELTGTVPASVTYQDWLGRQTEDFQNDVLGAERGQLFRDGMPLSRFVGRDGDVLTLDELHARGASTLFASADMDTTTLSNALDSIGGARQNALADSADQIDKLLGIRGTQAQMAGAWSDGAESSLATLVAPGADFETLRVAAAMRGELSGQRSVLAFQATEDNPNSFLGQLSMRGTAEDVNKAIQDAGLDAASLEPQSNGATRVYVFGQDQATLEALNNLGASHGESVAVQFGRGEFVGSTLADGSEQSWGADAINQYAATIRSYLAESHPTDAGEWERIFADWRRTESKLA